MQTKRASCNFLSLPAGAQASHNRFTKTVVLKAGMRLLMATPSCTVGIIKVTLVKGSIVSEWLCNQALSRN